MITDWKSIRRTKPQAGDGGTRKRLPATRQAITRKITVNNVMDVYVSVSFYPSSVIPGELFVKIGKVGSDIGGMFDALAASISVSLQYGAPWAKIVKTMKRYRFGLESTDESPSILHAVIVAADSLVRQYATTAQDAQNAAQGPRSPEGRAKTP